MIIIGGLGFALGFLMIMAGAMSDAPDSGNDTAEAGLIVAVASIALTVLYYVAKHNHWISG